MRNLTIGLAALGLALLSGDAAAHRYAQSDRYVVSIGGPGETDPLNVLGVNLSLRTYWITTERQSCQVLLDGAESGIGASAYEHQMPNYVARGVDVVLDPVKLTLVTAWQLVINDGGCTAWLAIERHRN